jgi:hypothetical protein
MRGVTWVLGLALWLIAFSGFRSEHQIMAAAQPSNQPADLLPYGTVMVGVSSMMLAMDATNADIRSVAAAATAQFYPGTTVATISVFLQLGAPSSAANGANNSTSGPSSSSELYRVCYNEPFDITTDEFGSRLSFQAAHDPFSCLSSVLLEFIPANAGTALFPVNLTATLHPYDPTRLMSLNLFDSWTIRMYPALSFSSVLRRATGGPVTYISDAAVSFCSRPLSVSAQSAAPSASTWSLRVMFAGAYNVDLFASAVDGTGVVCSGAGMTGTGRVVASAPVAYRMLGGRVDVLGSQWSPTSASVADTTDFLNATLDCVETAASASSRARASYAAFLFTVGVDLWVVYNGRSAVLSPDYCWQTAAFAKQTALAELVGRSYAGWYGDLIQLRFTISSVRQATTQEVDMVSVDIPSATDLADAWWVEIFANVSIPTFSANCAVAAAIPFSAGAWTGTLSDQSTCVGQALGAVANAPWLRLQYLNGADVWWASVYAGSFIMNRVA